MLFIIIKVSFFFNFFLKTKFVTHFYKVCILKYEISCNRIFLNIISMKMYYWFDLHQSFCYLTECHIRITCFSLIYISFLKNSCQRVSLSTARFYDVKLFQMFPNFHVIRKFFYRVLIIYCYVFSTLRAIFQNNIRNKTTFAAIQLIISATALIVVFAIRWDVILRSVR